MYTVYEYVQHLKDVMCEARIPHIELWTTGLKKANFVWEGNYDYIPTEFDDRKVTDVDIFYDDYFARIIMEITII